MRTDARLARKRALSRLPEPVDRRAEDPEMSSSAQSGTSEKRVITELRQRYDQLTSSQKRIAETPSRAANLSTVAKATNSGSSTTE